MIERGIWIATAILAFSGCVSRAYLSQDEILKVSNPHFSTCRGLEGSVNLSLYKDSMFVMDLDADWVAEESGNWRLQLTDRLGRPAGFVTYFATENVLAMTGSIQRQLPDLGVDPKGFMTVGGYFIGLQARDFPCHLAGRLPMRWHARVLDLESLSSRQKWSISDSAATIDLTFFTSSPTNRDYCFEASWPGFLYIFRRSIEFCRMNSTPMKSELSFSSNQLRLTELN